MGQSLNIEIRKKNKVIANAYYHWSGYTQEAFELTNEVINYITTYRVAFKDQKLLAIKALESTGAALPDYEDGDLDRIKNMSKYSTTEFAKFKSRNDGLISVFSDTIKETEKWAEGTSSINIDDLTISFDVFGYYDSIDDVKEYYGDFDENEIVVFNYDFNALSIKELSDVVSAVRSGKLVNLDGRYIFMK